MKNTLILGLIFFIVFNYACKPLKDVEAPPPPQKVEFIEDEEEIEIPLNNDEDLPKDENGNDVVVYTLVEDMPEFPGGTKKLVEYIRENVVYPEKDIKDGIKGVSYVRFIVNPDGSMTNVKIYPGTEAKGTGRMHAESIRLIEAMPKWEPGMQRGKAVYCYYSVPIRYKL